MRWSQLNTDYRQWYKPWFAWRPVMISGRWVWLEWIECRVNANYTMYRLPGSA
jgi:hypothetical protein